MDLKELDRELDKMGAVSEFIKKVQKVMNEYDFTTQESGRNTLGKINDLIEDEVKTSQQLIKENTK